MLFYFNDYEWKDFRIAEATLLILRSDLFTFLLSFRIATDISSFSCRRLSTCVCAVTKTYSDCCRRSSPYDSYGCWAAFRPA